jgi:limonene-1,2-epoxide hydrolase
VSNHAPDREDEMKKGMTALLFAMAVSLCAIRAALADSSADSEKVVRSFVASWTTKPIDEIVAHLDDDVVFINMPDPKPIKGRKDAKTFLEPFFQKDPLIIPFSFKTDVKHLAANGADVLLDRVDTFVIAGKTWEIPVATYFEVKDGRITVWKDYFDEAQFQAAATLIETLAKKK